MSCTRHSKWEKVVMQSPAQDGGRVYDASTLTDEELKARAEAVIQSALRREGQLDSSSMEISINHCRPDIRYQLTQKAILQEIMQSSGASVLNRGFFKENDASKPEDWIELSTDQKPLHLYITADSSEKVKHAARLINEIIEKSASAGVFTHRIYVDFAENVDFSFLKMNIIGTKGAYLKHIQNVSGCKVYLRGVLNGRGDSSLEPLNLYITGPDQKKLDVAINLTLDLLKTVKKKCEIWLKERSKVITAPSPSQHHSPLSHHYVPSNEGQKGYGTQQQQQQQNFPYFPYNCNVPMPPLAQPYNSPNYPENSTTEGSAINYYAYMTPEYYSYYAMMYQQHMATAGHTTNPSAFQTTNQSSVSENGDGSSKGVDRGSSVASSPQVSSEDKKDHPTQDALDGDLDPLLMSKRVSRTRSSAKEPEISAKRTKIELVPTNYSRDDENDNENDETNSANTSLTSTAKESNPPNRDEIHQSSVNNNVIEDYEILQKDLLEKLKK